MMTPRRRVLYAVLTAIVIAGAILAYTTWVTASRFRQLGEQTIADSTLLLVRELLLTGSCADACARPTCACRRRQNQWNTCAGVGHAVSKYAVC